MALKLQNARAGDMTNIVTDYSVDTVTLDTASGDKETSWTNRNHDQWVGMYKALPEIGSSIDAKSFWSVGKGWKAKEKKDQKRVEKILKRIKGWGKDTFNGILGNAVRVYNVAGDFYAEIVTTDDKPINDNASNLLNLKPLNSGAMSNVVNEQGILIRYDYQIGIGKTQPFEPHEIFHLPWNRFANEIHGQSSIERIEQVALMRNEAMTDMKVVFHRYVKPLWIWKLNTDDDTEIASFQDKADRTVKTGENIFIPMGAAEAERVSIPQYSTLDPLPWIENLTQYHYQAVGIPDVILGSAKGTTEASAKILYLSFQQTIETNQLFLEENVESQLHLKIELEFPASIDADLLKGVQKDGAVNIDPKDTTAGIKGKK